VLIASGYTINVDSAGVPVFGGGGSPVSVPTTPAAGGITSGFFAGRVYAPSATFAEDDNLNVFFAGYHTPKPKNGLGDYRTIGRVSLRSSQHILGLSTDLGGGEENDR
jgi:hypothetical protein